MKTALLIALVILSSAGAFAQSGNVGIGTSTPSTPLQVVGTVSSTSASTTASSTETTQMVPGAVELFRSNSSTAPNVNGYIDFKDNSTKDFDLRLLYDHTLGTNGGFSIVTSTNGGATNAGRLTVLNSDGRIGIGTSAPDASAKLDIQSTSQGVLVPRMTFAQRNAMNAPANGLLIYQTDSNSGFWHYDGTRWTSLNSPYGNIRQVNSNTTLSTDDRLVYTNNGAITITLPLANSVGKGHEIVLINTNPNAFGPFMASQSGDTIIYLQYGAGTLFGFYYSVNLVSDGNASWIVTSGQQ